MIFWKFILLLDQGRNIRLCMLCLSYAYKLQRLNTIGNGRQPMCSAFRTVNPVCSVSTVLCCTEVTRVELYF